MWKSGFPRPLLTLKYFKMLIFSFESYVSGSKIGPDAWLQDWQKMIGS